MNSRRASRCSRFSSEMVCAVAGASLVTRAGGQGGMTKASFWTLRAVYASAVIVRMRWPMMPSPLSVCTEAVFAFSSCWTICRVAKDGSVLLLPSVVRTAFGKFCVIWSFVDAIFANVYPLLLKTICEVD
jgi:hypothetical protein